MKQYATLPNLLSVSRFVAIPFILESYWMGQLWLALIIYIVASYTDVLDGRIARKSRQTSVLGQKLDSIADASLELTAVAMIYWNQPESIQALFTPLALLAGAFTCMAIVSLIRFHKIHLLHTILFKVGSLGIFFITVWSFFFNPTIPILLVSSILMLAFIEAIILFIKYGEVDMDTPSILSLNR